MHQIEACKQQISDFERLATNYKSLEDILMLNNAVQRTFLHMFARDIRKHIKINIIGEKSVSGGAIAHPSPRVSRPLIH